MTEVCQAIRAIQAIQVVLVLLHAPEVGAAAILVRPHRQDAQFETGLIPTHDRHLDQGLLHQGAAQHLALCLAHLLQDVVDRRLFLFRVHELPKEEGDIRLPYLALALHHQDVARVLGTLVHSLTLVRLHLLVVAPQKLEAIVALAHPRAVCPRLETEAIPAL